MFKLKIASLSVLISGSVLAAFGIFILTIISNIGIDRIDREIITLGESQLHVWHSKKHWSNFSESLSSIYGQEHWQNLIVKVTDANHEVLYQSPQWPEEIEISSFSEFNLNMATGVLPRSAENQSRLERPFRDGANGDRGFRERRPPPPPFENENRRRPLAADDQGRRQKPPRLRPPEKMEIKIPVFLTKETATGSWRTGAMGNQHITIMIGINMAGFYEDADSFKNALIYSVPLALLLIAVGGWIIAHRAIKPVELITQTAENISARGLDQRIPEIKANSEILRLTKVINAMLDRLERSFSQAVRFSADAAHELQTPLTILQGVLDDAVQNAESDTDEQRRYGSLLEEVQHLKSIVHKLLILAQADAGQLQLHLEPVNLSFNIESAIEDAAVIGPNLTIEEDIPSRVMVQADPDLMRLVIQGLTTNAVKYNSDNGLIRFRLKVENNRAIFSISNTGLLIPDSEQERIFDRFYRVNESRSDRVSGTGLGLSLAREIVHAHKGDLFFTSTPDNLNCFTVSIPI